MLSCKEACENATELLDTQTSVAQRLSLRFHLLLCKNCRRFFRQFNIMTDTAARLSEIPEPSDAEIDALVEKLAAANHGTDSSGS